MHALPLRFLTEREERREGGEKGIVKHALIPWFCEERRRWSSFGLITTSESGKEKEHGGLYLLPTSRMQ